MTDLARCPVCHTIHRLGAAHVCPEARGCRIGTDAGETCWHAWWATAPDAQEQVVFCRKLDALEVCDYSLRGESREVLRRKVEEFARMIEEDFGGKRVVRVEWHEQVPDVEVVRAEQQAT